MSNTCEKHGANVPTCKGCRNSDRVVALAELRALCPPGTTVYTILRSVSRSGMTRVITPFILDPVDGKPISIVRFVRPILNYPTAEALGHVGLKVGGCGMDMGFHLVNALSYALHGHTHPEVAQHMALKPGDLERPGYTLNHRWL